MRVETQFIAPHLRYFGRIRFAEALHIQQQQLAAANTSGLIMGFESEPVITLGIRSTAQDLLSPPGLVRAMGWEILQLDRGGQATVHNPGQLVIFPLLSIAPWGTREWVCRLAKVSLEVLARVGVEAWWDERSPGLYTSGGKIGSIGVRLRSGVSTHGIALNVTNNLADFSSIRVCGHKGAAVSRVYDLLGEKTPSLHSLFQLWCDGLQRHLTGRVGSLAIVDNLPNLDKFKNISTTDVRS